MISSRVLAQATRSAAPRVSIASRAASRSYAAAAPAHVKPPVQLFGVDGTYATALYTAAVKTSALDNTSKALENLGGVFKKDTKLSATISAPTLSLADKKAIVQELQKHVGQDKDGVVKNFLETLAENNRLGLLEGVVEKFTQLMSAARGEVEVVITSAQPLDAKVVRQLEGTISKSQYIAQGQKIKVVQKVNPEILGGLVVEVGDRTIDRSVSAKIAKLNKLLRDQL